MAKYKQKCFKCKKNYVLASSRQKWIVCYDCQKAEMQGEIKNPKMKKMFNIPEEFYKNNSFLRDIKVKYLKFGELSEKQIEVFKKVVEDLKKEKKEEN